MTDSRLDQPFQSGFQNTDYNKSEPWHNSKVHRLWHKVIGLIYENGLSTCRSKGAYIYQNSGGPRVLGHPYFMKYIIKNYACITKYLEVSGCQ